MFIISLISFFCAYSFAIIGIYIIKLNKKEILNKLAAGVYFCFTLWCLSNTFFYIAPTAREAMLWHRLGSIGWIMFCPLAAHYYLILSGRMKKWNDAKLMTVLYVFQIILLVKALFSDKTLIARNIIKSKLGIGWTYTADSSSIWFWLYLIYVITGLGVSLYFTYEWARKSNRKRLFRQARRLIALDIIIMALGIFTDLILPSFYPIIPPVSNITTIIWGVGFFYIIKELKMLNVLDAASPELILKTVMDPIVMLDSNGIIISCNKATENLLKLDMKQIKDKSFAEFCKSIDEWKRILDKVLAEKSFSDVEIDLVDLDGETINTISSFSIAESRMDEFIGIVLNLHDITKLKKVEEELYRRKEKYKQLSKHLDRLANYDKLTDIPNRRMFFSELEVAIEKFNIIGTRFALVFIDLDGFKPINDAYGHIAGDQVLISVSEKFAEAIRKGDLIARIGGDEFVIILSDLHNDLELHSVLDRLKKMISEPIEVEGNICCVGISIGISKCPEDGVTAEKLIEAADTRMYEEKLKKRYK